jgi:hypothetical protein
MGKRHRNKKSKSILCWCGSGKKYKDCHEKRESESPVTLQEVISTFKKTWGKEYCLSPTASETACSSQIIKAHTVQKNGGLSKIARKGHVYGFRYEWNSREDKKLPIATLIGINSASTFTGFCSRHDNSIFEPVEKYPFQNTPQQIFLLGYRAISREYFNKRAQYEMIPFTLGLDKGKPAEEQLYVQDFVQTYSTGIIYGLNDLKHHKSSFDKVLLSSNFSEVYYYTVLFENLPDLMCSGAVQIEYDFNGEILQDLAEVETPEYITFSLISTSTGGAAVFSWIGESPTCLKFVQSLHSNTDDEIPHAILRFCLDFFENVYFSPNWWDTLNDKQKQNIRERMNYRTEPTGDINHHSLKDDGVRVIQWKVVTRESNCVSV